MEEREVVITGLGAVTPLDRDVPSLWEGLVAARLDRGALFAVDAALQALGDAGLSLTPQNAALAGLVLGSARPGQARQQAVRHALSYAYGFGGHHVALCFSAP